MKKKNYLPGLLANIVLLFSITNVFAEEYEISPQIDGKSTEFNTIVKINTDKHKAGSNREVVWQKEYSVFGSAYLRIHFTDFETLDGDFEVRIWDSSNEMVQVIKSKAFRDRSDIWSYLITGSTALVEVFAPLSSSLHFKIDRIVHQKPLPKFYSITPPDGREHIAEYVNDPIIGKVQKAVAKLSFVKNDSPYVCTGFLLAPDKLLTNHHCISEQSVCNSAVVIFGFQFSSEGKILRGQQTNCSKVISSNYKLDYVLLELSDPADGEPVTLQWAEKQPGDKQPIYIIEHPAGQPKQISKVGCVVEKAVARGRHKTSDFSHYCDTLGGSSGSPVFNYDGHVIGLHHYGFGSGTYWDSNRAVRGKLIREDIEGQL